MARGRGLQDGWCGQDDRTHRRALGRRVRQAVTVVTTGEIRAIAARLPRSYEALVQDRVKFRVGRIVYLALSRDETVMGFAFPKEERGRPEQVPHAASVRHAVQLGARPAGGH